MKTYKLINDNNDILMFTERDLTYTLYIENPNSEPTMILRATDTGNGIKFTEKFGKDVDYSDAEYLRLFLNMMDRLDDSLFESYVITEHVGII